MEVKNQNSKDSFQRVIFGGSVLGWSINEEKSQKVLDFFKERGGLSIDTSDFYSEWVPGNSGGESERIIGNWMEDRNCRRDIKVITKVGLYSKRIGLSRENILRAADDSLKRLKTDYIDVYMPHRTPTEEEFEGFVDAMSKLNRNGLIKSVGFSHCSPDNLETLAYLLLEKDIPISICEDNFNIIEREASEKKIPLATGFGMQFIAARGLAGGFLSGKYSGIGKNYHFRIVRGQISHSFSSGAKALSKKYRSSLTSASISKYLELDTNHLFSTLKKISNVHEVNTASIAISWILLQKSISGVCVSFRSIDQLKSLQLVNLSNREVGELNSISLKFNDRA